MSLAHAEGESNGDASACLSTPPSGTIYSYDYLRKNEIKHYPYRPIRYHASDVKEVCPHIIVQPRKGEFIPFPIVNFSEGGLKFEDYLDNGSFGPGKMIDALQVVFGNDCVLTTPAKIKHKLINEKGMVEYGLKFLKGKLNIDQILAVREHLATSNFPVFDGTQEVYRGIRYGKEILSRLDIEASLAISSQIFKVHIKNISEFGFCFSLPLAQDCPDLIDTLTEGTVFENFTVKVDKEMLFSSRIKVSHRRNDDNDTLTVGVLCLDTHVPILMIFNLLKVRELRDQFSHFIAEVEVSKNIHSEFKSVLNDFRYFLEAMRNYLDQVDKKIKFIPDKQSQKFVEEQVISFSGKRFKEKVKNLAFAVGNSLRSFPEDQYKAHQKYFRDQMLPLLKDSIICKRSLEKPLGYAGDYEMMDIIYNGRFRGETLWQKMINYCITDFPPANAVRERGYYLRRKIFETIVQKKNSDHPIHILSLACGSCQEISDFLREEDIHINNTLSFYLIDQESRALDVARQTLYDIIQEKKYSINIVCLQQSVKSMVKNKTMLASLPKMDLIYVSGLYDYLPDLMAQLLTNVLLNLLGDNAKLIIGNFGIAHQFKFFIEYALDWFLIHRSPEDMKRFLPETGSWQRVFVEDIEDGINLFLNIQK